MYDFSKKIDELGSCKPARRKKRRRVLSLHEEVLSLVNNANSQVADERRIVPRDALTVMNRALEDLASLNQDSQRIGALREVNRFISLQHDTYKAHTETTKHGDLLPLGHPLCSLNYKHDAGEVRRSYAVWLAADNSVSAHVKTLVASAFASAPFSIERKHAFTRLNLSKDAAVPLFFKLDPIIAAFTFRGGNSSAARRARVALQWRDRMGRWVEMGRGIDFNFRLPDGSIASAGGTYVGVNAARGYTSENGKPVANAGLIEVRGDANIPDGIYSIESANASPVKARVPGQALKRAKVKATPGVRKPTAEESQSQDIPNLNDLLKTKVDAPSGWTKQKDGSFLSDDDYKAIPTDTGYALHRLDKDGNTGDKVADVSSWADVQSQAEKDSADYDKFKESVGIKDTGDEENRKGIEDARAAQDERKATIPPADKTDESLVPDNVGASGELPNGVTYTAEDKRVKVAVFPGRYAEVEGVRVALAGNTYDNRLNIKRLGFKWNNADKVWYKNYVDTDLLGSSHNTTHIREQLDGIGGGDMPRFAGDNENIVSVIQDARNKMIDHFRAVDPEQKDRAKAVADILFEAGREINNRLSNIIPNDNEDRIRSRKKIQEFLKEADSKDFPQGLYVDQAREFARDAITLLDEKIGDVKDTKEPDVTPEARQKSPQKVASRSESPNVELFKEFDVPNGAFQLRTIAYEPDGRVDEESRDFTDDPNVLAKRYPLPILVRALTESLIGKKDDSVIADIVDSNLGDDDESLDLEELNDVVDTPAPQAGRANGTGAGTLDFSAGEEFVPAESLYNAVFKAGGDPNRVIANAYDAIFGDRRNLEKLTNASGNIPSPEEQQLIDDMMQEINQIKQATPDGESPVSNAVSEPEQEPLPGELLQNIPVNFDNPDYAVIDPSPYIPIIPTPDENGYSDSPEYLARNFEEADLLQQFIQGITDGSGSSYFIFSDGETYMEGTAEVPVEAVRDALQLLGVNTNTVLENLRDESNNFDESQAPATPEPTPTPQAPTPAQEVSMDAALSVIRARHENYLNDLTPVAYLPRTGSIIYKDAWGDLLLARADGVVEPVNAAEAWILDPNGAGQAGWRAFTDEEKDVFSSPTGEAPQAAPAAPETPAAPEAPAAPTFQYPGPREPGYSRNNTTMVRGGAIVGQGSRVVAIKDGKSGTVVAIQNDPEYLRIRFDDGTTAVRAAAKVKAILDPSGAAPRVVKAEEQKPAQGVETRLDQPVLPAPRIARSGDTAGVNNDSTVPDWLNGLTNDAAAQSDFAAWGSRDAEIAKAARERISLDNLEKELAAIYIDRKSDDQDKRIAASKRLSMIMGDVYGDRSGITFGGEFFTVNVSSSSVSAFTGENEYSDISVEDVGQGKASYKVDVNMEIRDVSGNKVGDIRRIVYIKKKLDENKNIVGTDMYVKNEYLAIIGGSKKKKGFATAFNRYSENWYIANGASKVKVYAAGGGQYQGGFVWALNGFNWDPEYGRPGVNIGDFQREVKNPAEEAQVQYLKEKAAKAKKPNGEVDYSIYPTPLEFALVGWYPGATDWIGKRVMSRNSWNGIKTLQPQAREQVQAVNYNQIKNAERRIDSKQNIPNLSSNAQTLVESDSFRNNNVIAPYFTEIRDVLKNNRSLAVLSPGAKNALNEYVSKQMFDKNRQLTLEDAFRLRSGLADEYKADYGYSDPFNSAEILSEFSVQDFVDASEDQEYTDLNAAGFTVRQLGYNEGGVNSTFEVTHVASGQVFFVKNEEFASRFSDTPGGVTELEAATLLRAAGMQGIHDVRIGKDNKNIVIMSRAGASVPLAKEAVNANDGLRRGIKDANGRVVNLYEPEQLVNSLDTPEDIIRMSIFDIIGNNQDRHNGNWMIGYDKATGKLRVFPVDNTVGYLEINPTYSPTLEYLESGNFNEADVYLNVMPEFIKSIGTDDLLDIYTNEVKNIVSNLDNPLYQPKGFEMDAIIAKWGSYDAFKDAITKRLNALITRGTPEYNALRGALRLGYWS